MRRWSLHILTQGYVKTRRFGGCSNRHRQRYLAECRELLDAAGLEAVLESTTEPPTAPATAEPLSVTPSGTEPSVPSCPACGERMQCLAATDRPGWSVVMRSPHRPKWYDDG